MSSLNQVVDLKSWPDTQNPPIEDRRVPQSPNGAQVRNPTIVDEHAAGRLLVSSSLRKNPPISDA